MTDREAIELFQSKCALCKVRATCESLVAEGKSPCLNLNAISALQEREKRSKGCEFCNTYDFGRCGIDEYHIFMAGGNSRVDANEQFKFCPMCGRKLKGVQDESICM